MLRNARSPSLACLPNSRVRRIAVVRALLLVWVVAGSTVPALMYGGPPAAVCTRDMPLLGKSGKLAKWYAQETMAATPNSSKKRKMGGRAIEAGVDRMLVPGAESDLRFVTRELQDKPEVLAEVARLLRDGELEKAILRKKTAAVQASLGGLARPAEILIGGHLGRLCVPTFASVGLSSVFGVCFLVRLRAKLRGHCYSPVGPFLRSEFGPHSPHVVFRAGRARTLRLDSARS